MKTQKIYFHDLLLRLRKQYIYIYIVNYRQLLYDELLENNTNSKYIRNMVQVTLKNIIY